jgi:hypothetical protein
MCLNNNLLNKLLYFYIRKLYIFVLRVVARRGRPTRRRLVFKGLMGVNTMGENKDAVRMGLTDLRVNLRLFTGLLRIILLRGLLESPYLRGLLESPYLRGLLESPYLRGLLESPYLRRRIDRFGLFDL